MSFPLNAFSDLGLDASLLVSLLVGIGFGFALERGGFGSAKVLAGIFYFKDWRVLKVMFTAIVVAMLGLYLAEGAGLVVMGQLAYRSTYIYAQVVGGLILGVGFVVAGYCPGTSIVGAVSGKLDAVVVLVGVVLGIGVFEESYALLKDFYLSGYMGEISIATWAGLPQGVVVFAVVLVALAAFWGTERFGPNGKLRDQKSPALLKSAGVAMGAGVLVTIVQLAGPGQSRPIHNAPAQAGAPAPLVATLDLADWLVAGRPGLLPIDVREDRTEAQVPGAMALPVADLTDLRLRPLLSRDGLLVLIDEDGGQRGQLVVASLRASGFDAVLLEGGAQAWGQDILATPDAGGSIDPRAAALRLLVSGKSAFEGAAPPPPPNPGAVPPPRKKKKGGGC